MKQRIFLKNSVSLLISVCFIVSFPFHIRGNEYRKSRTFQVWNNGLLSGKIQETVKQRENAIGFEKKITYLSGKTITYNFTIKDDFSSYQGKIIRSGGQTIDIDDRTLTISKNGLVKTVEFEKGVIPSNLMHQYIHRLLRIKKQLPADFRIIYENTGDVFNVALKQSKVENFLKIQYKVKALNMEIHETYFPAEDAYCLEAGSLYIIDETLKSHPLWKLGKFMLRPGRNVLVPPGFSGFTGKKQVEYRLTFPFTVTLPGDSRQIILKKETINKERVYYLKVSPISPSFKIKDNGYHNDYDNYVRSFVHLEELKTLGVEVSKGAGNNHQKIQKILSWIRGNISLSNAELIEPHLVLKEKRGECQGISNLFLAMCSGIKIKGRVAIGLVIINLNNSYTYAFHQWVELWEGDGWTPYDPTAGKRGIGLNFIKLFDLKKKADVLKLTAFLKIHKVEIL